MAANPIPPSPNPNEKLVRVFDTDEETEALVVKGLLDSAGIDAQIRGVDNTQDVLPIGGTVILVREEDGPAARQLLEDYHRSPAQEVAEEALFDAAAETAEYSTLPGEDRSIEDRSIEDPKAEK
jgi:hypothetical protein